MRADGLASPPLPPMRGLVPGRPAATHWLVLVPLGCRSKWASRYKESSNKESEGLRGARRRSGKPARPSRRYDG